MNEFLKRCQEERRALLREMNAVIDGAKAERRDLRSDESNRLEMIQSDIEARNARIAELQAISASEAEANEARAPIEHLVRPLPNGRGYNGTGRELRSVNDMPESEIAAIGDVFAGMAFGEKRAMNEGTATAGGFTVPVITSGTIIDLVRSSMQTRAAGVRVVSLDSNEHKFPKAVSEPAPTWRAENAAFTEADAVFGSVDFNAKSAGLVYRASWELLQDSAGLGDFLLRSLQQSTALELDRVVLRGSGTGEEPTGVLNTTGVTKTALDGASLTFDHLIDEVGALRAVNYSPSGILLAPRSQKDLGSIKDADGNYLTAPPYISDVRRFETGQIPVNLSYTDAVPAARTDGSEVYVADWSNVVLGIRQDIKVIPLSERYADQGQMAWVVFVRADVNVVRTNAVRILNEIGAAA